MRVFMCDECKKETEKTGRNQKRCSLCAPTVEKRTHSLSNRAYRKTLKYKKSHKIARQKYDATSKGKAVQLKNDATPKRKMRHLTFKFRHNQLRFRLSKEGVSQIDPLWSFSYYKDLLNNSCHYCQGPLSCSGIGIDRIDNKIGHIFNNVVPCCGICNTTKGAHFSYSEMMLLAPVLQEIRKRREVS